MKLKILLFTTAFCASFVMRAAPAITQADRDRAAGILAQMTLEEKCRLISGQVDKFHTYGIERLGVPSLLFADATMGVRKLGNEATYSTCFPAAIATAASFNRDAARTAGKQVAVDCKARGVAVLLGPGVNIYRNALCGRNFEYMGEDPFLTGELASEYIMGMQDEGVMATIKHYALNNQEYNRHEVDSRADERTMQEIYLPAFKKAVQKANVAAVMSSYNPVNGTHASENTILLAYLREWGFNGIIMSDWVSTYSTIGCCHSQLDMEFPGNQMFTPENIIPLVENGIVPIECINEKCMHVLQTIIAFGYLDRPAKDESIALDNAESRKAALDMARESIAMVSNNGILPLKKGTVIVTGENADKLAMGGGSSRVFPVPGRKTTLAEAFRHLDKKYKVVFSAYPSEEQLKSADAVIIAAGFDYKTETEGSDRKFALPSIQSDEIDRCLAASDKVILILNSGGEIEMKDWNKKAAAILCAWYQGQEGGTALAEIITGKISPSGRLPFTWWGSEKKNPTCNYYHPSDVAYGHSDKRHERCPLVEYKEGVFVGYRGIERFGNEPVWPFGFGLTYGDFTYSDLQATMEGKSCKVSFKLTNKGQEASEVAQVYVAPVNPSVPRPARELKEFAKIKLAKGESRTVQITLPSSAFEHYDMLSHAWVADKGTYKIQIGASATDIRAQVDVEIK